MSAEGGGLMTPMVKRCQTGSDRQTKRHQDQAGLRDPGIRPAVADHVRTAVRVCIRQCDRRSRRSYQEFLIAGILAPDGDLRSNLHGAGLAEDMQKGIIDRFRSLPMSASAVLVGRTTSDIIYNVLSVAIMAVTGLVVGWRIGPLCRCDYRFRTVVADRLRLLVGHGVVGPPGPQRRGDQQRLVHGDLPLTFVANTFVPVDNLPRCSRPSRNGIRCRR